MSNLFRAVGRIEGMLTQFLGLHEATTKRIDAVEAKQDEHDNRIETLEKWKVKVLAYIAGATLVIGGIGWLADMALRAWTGQGVR